jgi:hypothetical protein
MVHVEAHGTPCVALGTGFQSRIAGAELMSSSLTISTGPIRLRAAVQLLARLSVQRCPKQLRFDNSLIWTGSLIRLKLTGEIGCVTVA